MAFYSLEIVPVGVSDAGRNHVLFLSYIGLSPEGVVVGEQHRAPFGSLLLITDSLRCSFSGETFSRLTFPFVLTLSASLAFCLFRCWAVRIDKQK